jgi:hypothetical protein
VKPSYDRAVWRAAAPLLALALGACGLDASGGPAETDAAGGAAQERAATAPVSQPSVDAPGAAESLPAVTRATVCGRFVLRLREAAARHGGDVEAFLRELNDEFTGGTGDPFAMKEGLRGGRWNQDWFYAGHGGFRPEFDDAQRYPRGGNHQPGHFVAVLTIAARFGGDAAAVAIAYAGDYDPGDEDDLRLSQVAIRLGSALSGGSATAADVARDAAVVCR